MIVEAKEKKKSEEIAQEIMSEFSTLSGSRGNFESHWREIAERIIPSHSNLFEQNSSKFSKGEKRNQELYDSTASIALNRFGSILDSLLTPRNQTWHRLAPTDPMLSKDRSVKLWFEEVNRLLFKYRYMPAANFASQNQLIYKSLGAYGTGSMFVDQLFGEVGFRYKNVHLGEVYFKENHQGVVDAVLRKFTLTARQAMQKWGEGRLPEKLVSMAKTKPETEFDFIHCVKPRKDKDIERLDYKGMNFASYYVCMDSQSLVEEGGYRTMPYSVSRYEQIPGETYGRSPAMDVLPAIKTLNEEKKTVLKQGHRAVDPVLLAHDDGIVDSFSLRPGAINAGGVSAEGRALVQALPVGNISIGKDLMDDERAVINDAFLVTLFQILVETPEMTATEVMERTREKGILLAPVLGRQQTEYLGPMIEREIDLLSFQGKLPPMPQVLVEAGGEYRVEYDSPLSRAQRAEEASGLMRTLESTLTVVNITQDPAPLDHFDWDVIIPEVSEIQGVPARWMRDPRIIAQMRESRSQSAQTQEAIQAAPGIAAVTKAAAVAQRGK